jgi:hypothetical protein
VRSLLSMFGRFIRVHLARDVAPEAVDDDGDPTHIVWWTPARYRQVIEQAGFSITLQDHYLYRSSRAPRVVSWFAVPTQRALDLISMSPVLFVRALAMFIKRQLAFATFFLAVR